VVDRHLASETKLPAHSDAAGSASSVTVSSKVDFERLYEGHSDYAARRLHGSFEQQQIAIEVQHFKLPYLLGLLPAGQAISSVLEIGCATGELIASFPVEKPGVRHGVDISPSNIRVAKSRFPWVDFTAGDFRSLALPHFDCVVISDVLEHVDDDAGFLRDAAHIADRVLVNLPLEDNWLNRNRDYGPSDVSGHLRKYSLPRGLQLFSDAGLMIRSWKQIWIHETEADVERRRLRERYFGASYAGPAHVRWLKSVVAASASSIRPLGRRLFASNLFVLATSTAMV
jgi:SAM-dependent methyltransferase